jgi:hypothetical protein
MRPVPVRSLIPLGAAGTLTGVAPAIRPYGPGPTRLSLSKHGGENLSSLSRNVSERVDVYFNGTGRSCVPAISPYPYSQSWTKRPKSSANPYFKDCSQTWTMSKGCFSTKGWHRPRG